MFADKTARAAHWTREDRWWLQPSPFGPLPVVLGELGLRRIGLDPEARPPLITALSSSKALRLKAGVARVSAQLEAYFEGSLKRFELPLAPLMRDGFLASLGRLAVSGARELAPIDDPEGRLPLPLVTSPSCKPRSFMNRIISSKRG